jgi:hypothetical protein
MLAEETMQSACQRRRELLGHEHPGMIAFKIQLARIWLVMGKVSCLASLLDDCLSHSTNILGHDHPTTHTIKRMQEDALQQERNQMYLQFLKLQKGGAAQVRSQRPMLLYRAFAVLLLSFILSLPFLPMMQQKEAWSFYSQLYY